MSTWKLLQDTAYEKDAIWRENGVHVLREQAEQASQAAVNLVQEVFGGE